MDGTDDSFHNNSLDRSLYERKKPKKRKKKIKALAEDGFDNDAYTNEGHLGHSAHSARTSYASASNVDVLSPKHRKHSRPAKEQEIKEEHQMSLTARSLYDGPMDTIKVESQTEQSHGLPPALKKHIIDSYVRDFVVKNIKHRECCRYVRNPKLGNCKCGRPYAWHSQRKVKEAPQDVTEWNASKDTQQIKANSFGTIRFTGFGSENTRYAPYIRVESDLSPENMENVWSLIHLYWHVPPPKLIISVTGGAKRFALKPRLKQSFKRGLVNAATTTGAWIVTGGNKAGVMEFVGEAVKEYQMTQGVVEQQIVALGIATWGSCDNKEALVGEEGKGLFPAVYDIDDLSSESTSGVSALDPNHSHFILVDNGTERKFGAEIEFRANFEQYMSRKMKVVSQNNSVDVPVVSLVLEGGENTLNTAKSAIESGTPVVVVNGSGRAANFIAKAYRVTKEKKIKDKIATEFPPGFDKEFEGYASYMFDWSREKDPKDKERKITSAVNAVKVLLGYRKMITVFTMDDDDTTNEIDQAILNALLKAKGSDIQTQLNLALAWNRCDVARNRILTVENRMKWQDQNYGNHGRNILYEALFTALIQDKMDFVQLFIDNGVDLQRFLTVRRLRDLYDDIVLEKKYQGPNVDLIRNLIQHLQSPDVLCCQGEYLEPDSPELLKYVGMLIGTLLGDMNHMWYQDDKRFVVREGKDDPHSTFKHGTRRHTKQEWTPDFECAARELFIWSILLNRRGLALFFWKMGRDHLGGALIASALLKSLAKEAERDVEVDLSQDMLDHAESYEQHAVGVLSVCYSKEKDLTHQLLTRCLSTWGGTTLYTVADSAEQMAFMGHTACQTKLNKIWMGRMALYTPIWKILLSLFCPLFLFGIKFTPNDSDEEAQILKTRKDRVGESKPSLETMKEINKTFTERDKLAKVTACGKCTKVDGNNIAWFDAAFLFYRSPIVKFCFHTISYGIFLALFSYFVMVELRDTDQDNWLSLAEFILWGWAITLILEEVRQVLMKDSNSLTYKVSGYFSSIWNVFDQFVHFMFVVSIVLRFALHGDAFIWARIFYCLTLLFYYLRFMEAFFISRQIGPKVIMIQRMLYDLTFFICILIVFILAYGVVAQALRFPNAEASFTLLKDVVYMPYWQMYGELFLEDLEGDITIEKGNVTIDCNDTPNADGCPQNNALVIVLFAIYMMMTNVLLLNLLIAMFSYTFDRIQESSETIWRFYRYNLIYEYFDRPTLAPPLIIINHIVRACKYSLYKCQGKDKISNDFKIELRPEADNKLTAFERVGMENYLHNQHLLERELIDNKVQSTSERIEKVIEDLEGIREFVAPKSDDFDEVTKEVVKEEPPPPKVAIDKEHMDELHMRLNHLEIYLQNQQQQLDDQRQQMDTTLQLLRDLVTASGRGGGIGGGDAGLGRPHFDPLVPASTSLTTLLPGAVDPYYAYRQMGPQVEIQDAPRPDDQSKS